jgi:hypothetical protein
MTLSIKSHLCWPIKTRLPILDDACSAFPATVPATPDPSAALSRHTDASVCLCMGGDGERRTTEAQLGDELGVREAAAAVLFARDGAVCVKVK